jgi:uncharacterized membrane protein YuzA (DUF378 family)
MNMSWYVIILIGSSALFLISSIGSLLFGGMDTDMDVDVGAGDGLSFSDIISFKGLLHFLIGFSLVLTLMGGVTVLSVIIGVITGLIFVVALFYIYKFTHEKLQHHITYTTEINGLEGEVYYWDKNRKIGEVFVVLEGRPVTVTLQSDDENIHLEKGQKIIVQGNRNLVRPKIESSSAIH